VILVTYLFDCCCVDGHKEYPIIMVRGGENV
jgi:hypothetical protein